MDENRNPQEETEHEHTLWEYGREPSSLEASHEDMNDVRRDIIRFALEQHPIRDIRTYAGYRGDLLVEITTPDPDLIPRLKEYAESLGMETTVKMKFDVSIHEIYCITPNEDIYEIRL